MNKTKIIVLVALALVIVGGLGGWIAFSSSDHVIDVAETKTLEQDFSSIAIDADNMGIEIRPAEEEVTVIEMVGQTHKSVSYSLDATIEDNVLIVSANMSNPPSWTNIYINNLKIVVSLPEKQYHSLRAEGTGGMIHLEGLQIDDIYCNTKSSGITLETITSKTVTVEADAYVGLSDVECNSIFAKTSASLELERVEADEITARTAARILLSTSHIDRDIDLESSSGSIQVKTEQAPENVRFDVSSSGSINLFGGKYAGNINSDSGEYVVRLAAAGSITVEEVS